MMPIEHRNKRIAAWLERGQRGIRESSLLHVTQALPIAASREDWAWHLTRATLLEHREP
jgi:hypothetical protein